MAPNSPSRDESPDRADIGPCRWWSRGLRFCNTPWGAAYVIAFVLLLQIKWWWQPTLDGGAYLSIARAMSQGKLELCGRPHLHYAPGYAAFIAPAFLLSDKPFLTISLMHFALGLALAAGLYRWFCAVAPREAGWLTIFVMLNASLLHQHRYMHGEVLFMTGLVWSVEILRRLLAATGMRHSLGLAVLGGLLITLTSFTRQVGIFLVPGYCVAAAVLAWRGRLAWTRAAWSSAWIGGFVTLCVLAMVAWDQAMARQAGAMAYGEYFDDGTTGFWLQIVEGARLRISECGRLLLPGMMTASASAGNWLNVNVILYLACSAGVAYGWCRLVRRMTDPFLWMLPFYAGMYVCWPHDQGTRYMLPMLPVLALAAWELIRSLRTIERPQAILHWGLALHAAASFVFWADQTTQSYSLRPQLAELETLSERLAAERHEVALYHPRGALRANAILCFNQLFPAAPYADQSADRPRWLITPPLENTVAGYQLQQQYSEFSLWKLAADVPQVAGRD